jgi:hypothetical protein
VRAAICYVHTYVVCVSAVCLPVFLSGLSVCVCVCESGNSCPLAFSDTTLLPTVHTTTVVLYCTSPPPPSLFLSHQPTSHHRLPVVVEGVFFLPVDIRLIGISIRVVLFQRESARLSSSTVALRPKISRARPPRKRTTAPDF